MGMPPILTPVSVASKVILPPTGNANNVFIAGNLPYGVYLNSPSFISGAVDQVAFTYKMLGGDVLDIEIKEENVYAAYEISVLEYSSIINFYQAKNALIDFLGSATGSFDQNGEFISGSALSGTNPNLLFQNMTFAYANHVASGISNQIGYGGTNTVYSSSVAVTPGIQDYDLQATIVAQSNAGAAWTSQLSASGGKQISIHKVFYKSPSNFWRFYGYYGGLTVVGNLNTYGQYSDDSTFEMVPAWQNKLQAQAFETNLFTRASHYSYEIRNNKIRLFPCPTVGSPTHIWFYFSIDLGPTDETPGENTGLHGVNNFNNLPYPNIPYESINSAGKNWIRRYALAVAKGILAQVRGKFQVIPIPGESVTLNHADLTSQSNSEMEKLKDELKKDLEELTNAKAIEREASIVESAQKIQQHIPMSVYIG